MANKLKHAEYEERLLLIESELYPIESYINMTTKIAHKCINEHIIYVAPNSTLKGTKCLVCSGYNKITTKEYIKELEDIGCNFRPIENYKSGKQPLQHKCENCGNTAYKTRREMLEAPNCKICAKPSLLRPAILYFVKLCKDSKVGYKIGITQTPLRQRFRSEKNLTVIPILEKTYLNKSLAELAEAEILYQYKNYLINDTILTKDGNTEIFVNDISDKIKAPYFT